MEEYHRMEMSRNRMGNGQNRSLQWMTLLGFLQVTGVLSLMSTHNVWMYTVATLTGCLMIPIS